MMVATKPQRSDVPFQEVIIVKSSKASSDTNALADDLAQQCVGIGSLVEIKNLARAASIDTNGDPTCKDKFIISLLEIETPLISDLPENEFYDLRTLITNSKGILWVTRGSKISATPDPRLRAISGVFRVIKSENTRLRLHELHLSGPADSNLETIVRTFKSMPSKDVPDLETEIVEEDGYLKIPRVVDERYKNWEIHTAGSMPPPEFQPLIQPGRPLALALGVPGILESLYFVDDDSLSGPLAANEVEVEVQANSLNYK